MVLKKTIQGPAEMVTGASEAQSARIRVVFVITRLSRGGAEHQLSRVALGLDRSRFDPVVVSVMPPVDLVDTLEKGGVPVYNLGVRRGHLAAAGGVELLRILREHQADVVVAFLFHAYMLARLVGPLAGCRVISSVRTERESARWRDVLTSASDRLSPVTVTNSQAVADALVRRGVVGANRVRMIPNGIASPPVFSEADRRALRERVRLELGLGPQKFLWCHVGRLAEAKDHPTLLKAFAHHSEICPEIQMILVGGGERELEVRSEIERHSLGGRVHLLGHRTDVHELLAASDGFVLSSAWEGSPNALIEAMSMGLPSVSTLVGGVGEVIEDKRDGWVVPARDPRKLADAMTSVVRLRPEERARVGAAGRRRTQELHDMRHVIAQWQEVISEVGDHARKPETKH